MKKEAASESVEVLGQNAHQNIPPILFCGWDVYSAMPQSMKNRTSPENVSDVLDTVVRLLRALSVVNGTENHLAAQGKQE